MMERKQGLDIAGWAKGVGLSFKPSSGTGSLCGLRKDHSMDLGLFPDLLRCFSSGQVQTYHFFWIHTFILPPLLMQTNLGCFGSFQECVLPAPPPPTLLCLLEGRGVHRALGYGQEQIEI